MLVTDLSDNEIILGKLAARLAPVLALVACGVPVTALAVLLGGIDPGALLGALLVTVALAVLGCSLALTFSIWAGKAHEVLMADYLVWFFWLLALPLWWVLHQESRADGAAGLVPEGECVRAGVRALRQLPADGHLASFARASSPSRSVCRRS